MSARRLNLLTCELDESLDRAGFRHTGATIGPQIGAERIGASVYEAEAGHAIWPYHYHYAAEEWLYVVTGAPILRDPGGERALRSGDLLCFPAGPLGAHAVGGPGRFIVFSADAPGPYVAVFPDSDKIAVWTGVPDLDALILPRAAAVDYWHGEGTEAASQPVEVVREGEAPSRPVVNTLEMGVTPSSDTPAAFGSRVATLTIELGAERLAATVLELDPGEGSAEYRYEYGRENWMLVLAGTPTLRDPDGEDALATGDVVCFPEGPAGAQGLINRRDEVARVLFISTAGLPANLCYPDSGRWLMRNGRDSEDRVLREL